MHTCSLLSAERTGILARLVPALSIVDINGAHAECGSIFSNGTSLEMASPGARRRNKLKVPKGHSITSSAATSRVCGTVRPSAFAVLRLMTKSNLVGCSTGNSVGLAPLRIRPT